MTDYNEEIRQALAQFDHNHPLPDFFLDRGDPERQASTKCTPDCPHYGLAVDYDEQAQVVTVVRHDHAISQPCHAMCSANIVAVREPVEEHHWGEKPRAEKIVDFRTATIEDLPDHCTRSVPHAPHNHTFGGDVYGQYPCDGNGGIVRPTPPEAQRAIRLRKQREQMAARVMARALDRPWVRRATSALVIRLTRTHAADVLAEVTQAVEDSRKDHLRMARVARRDGNRNQQTYSESVAAGLDTAVDYLRRVERTLRGPAR